MKSRDGKSQPREEKKKEKVSEERKSRCAKRQESRETLRFPMICGSRGSKSRLDKAAGAEPAGQMRDEKLHTVVARSTFRSQNVKNTTGSDLNCCVFDAVNQVQKLRKSRIFFVFDVVKFKNWGSLAELPRFQACR